MFRMDTVHRVVDVQPNGPCLILHPCPDTFVSHAWSIVQVGPLQAQVAELEQQLAEAEALAQANTAKSHRLEQQYKKEWALRKRWVKCPHAAARNFRPLARITQNT